MMAISARAQIMKSVISLVSLLVVAWASRDVPAAETASPLQALGGSVTIKRDHFGVPHIYADTVRRLFYGYGYAAAEDRLFQLEMLKRTATGRVSEILGSKYLDVDRTVVQGYAPGSIKSELEHLSRDDRDIFEGIAAGINARIKDVTGKFPELLPHEFGFYQFTPSTWDSFDVAMLWIGSMANRYSDINLELENAGLLQALEKMHDQRSAWQIFNQLRWEHDSKALTTIDPEDAQILIPPTFAVEDTPAAFWMTRDIETRLPIAADIISEAAHRQQLASGGVGIDFVPHASNIWLAGRAKTVDGSAVLVNGPQMGNYVPGWMWSVGLHGAGFNSVGNTPVGFPFVQFGSNERIAWGSTAGLGDTVDIYRERLNPADPHAYWFQGSWHPMGRCVETIRVKGQADVSIEVFSTIHGIVLSFDLRNHRAYARRRTWEGREVESLMGWIDSTKANNWQEFERQASRMAITINWYYADRGGNIGYQLTGLYPKRVATQDFRLPASGEGDMQWKGFYPFSNNPRVYNPKSGFIANWNNLSHPRYNSSDYLYWSAEDHVAEITAHLTRRAALSGRDLWEINRDTSFADANARFFVPLIVEAAAGFAKDTDEWHAAQLLRDWNRRSAGPTPVELESPAATIFRAWIPAALDEVLAADIPADELSQLEHPTLGSPLAGAPTHGTRILFNALLPSQSGVPQSFDLLHGKDLKLIVRQGLTQAVQRLRAQYGSDMSRWQTPLAEHRFSTDNYFGVPDTTPDQKIGFSPLQNRGTENDWIVMSREKVTRCEVAPPGESGLIDSNGARSAHYDDQMKMYQEFACKPVWLSAKDVDANIESSEQLSF